MALKVIGAGYGRTGTASLKLALERLGLGPCHHMSEVLPSPERVALWTRIGEGERGLWDAAFDGYAATVDWPACTYWRELMGAYPDAKVILSRREAGKWFESVNGTILSARLCEALARTPVGRMLDVNIWRLFGGHGSGRMEDRAHMTACFERHNEEVVRGVPKDRLLVFDARDGWGPLCAFLGVDAPAEPYPHVNSKEETARVMEMLIADVAGRGREGAAASAEMARGLFKDKTAV